MKEQLNLVDHIALNVADISRAVHWYTTSFNCKLVYQNASEAMIQFGNIRLQLILPSQVPQHIALRRPDAGSFGELRESQAGFVSTFVSDPTGNMIEIINES